jgi:hypothetical protein
MARRATKEAPVEAGASDPALDLQRQGENAPARASKPETTQAALVRFDLENTGGDAEAFMRRCTEEVMRKGGRITNRAGYRLTAEFDVPNHAESCITTIQRSMPERFTIRFDRKTIEGPITDIYVGGNLFGLVEVDFDPAYNVRTMTANSFKAVAESEDLTLSELRAAIDSFKAAKTENTSRETMDRAKAKPRAKDNPELRAARLKATYEILVRESDLANPRFSNDERMARAIHLRKTMTGYGNSILHFTTTRNNCGLPASC